VQVVGVSAQTGQGVDELLDALLLQAEVLELKASSDAPARGAISSSSLEKGRGAVATVLVALGHAASGRRDSLRLSFRPGARDVRRSRPDGEGSRSSIPVAVLGLSGLPDAGDEVIVVADERKAKELAELRERRVREQKLAQGTGRAHGEVFAGWARVRPSSSTS